MLRAIPHLDFARWALDIPPKPGATRWLPGGWNGVLVALPFALWFYLAIEQLPLAAEESYDPKRDMPKGILYGLLTLIACSFLTLYTSAAISPGAAKVAESQEPLFLGFQTMFGSSAKILAGALQHHDARVAIALEALEIGIERIDQRRIERVEAFRTIERHPVDAVVMLDQQRLGHGQLPIVVLDKLAARAPIQDP